MYTSRDRAGHTKAFDYPIVDQWGKSKWLASFAERLPATWRPVNPKSNSLSTVPPRPPPIIEKKGGPWYTLPLMLLNSAKLLLFDMTNGITSPVPRCSHEARESRSVIYPHSMLSSKVHARLLLKSVWRKRFNHGVEWEPVATYYIWIEDPDGRAQLHSDIDVKGGCYKSILGDFRQIPHNDMTVY